MIQRLLASEMRAGYDCQSRNLIRRAQFAKVSQGDIPAVAVHQSRAKANALSLRETAGDSNPVTVKRQKML
jgi:hypothetical protein